MASVRQHMTNFFKRNNVSLLSKNNCRTNSLFIRKFNNAPIEYTNIRDPAPFFFNKDIQNVLKKLTRININKLFSHKRLEAKKLESPVYKFMTDDELKLSLEQSAKKANDMLQMPPVIKVRNSINEILSEDPAIQRYDSAKYIFTDITYGVTNKDRLIVIRNVNGTLSKADWDTRQRMNQIYFPQIGRELKKPRMFQDEYLKQLLKRSEYEFILNKACVQFEPDDPEYQKVTSVTYQHLNEQNDFEMLRSTRHFGPLVFFLTWFQILDNLLLELIETSHIADANSLIYLHNKLHEPVGEGVQLESENDTAIIERFISERSGKKGQLELALQSYKELLKQQLELQEGIKKAHGVV